jgi:hypothetical protein
VRGYILLVVLELEAALPGWYRSHPAAPLDRQEPPGSRRPIVNGCHRHRSHGDLPLAAGPQGRLVQVHHLHHQATTSKSNQRTAAYDFLQLHPLGVLLLTMVQFLPQSKARKTSTLFPISAGFSCNYFVTGENE